MRKSTLFFYTIIFIFFVACSDNDNETIHSAYYWTTTFQLSDMKNDFIRKHDVRRLYLRFFDVVMDPKNGAIPNATIKFQDTVSDTMEIIPTVFIMNECMHENAEDMAEKVVKRVLQMCETHHIPNVHELQMDCDWTKRTQDRYFTFLEKAKVLLKEKDIKLSATIRLHQLSMKEPPVDRGVLMVYNTGDVTDRSVRNPILDAEEAKPYFQYLSDYQLPLSAAYPIFSWDVIFRGSQFVGIRHFENEYPTMAMDTVITYKSEREEILKAKELIDKVSPQTNDEIIIYDLSDKNLQNPPFTY